MLLLRNVPPSPADFLLERAAVYVIDALPPFEMVNNLI
jgi:hypothetical protein